MMTPYLNTGTARLTNLSGPRQAGVCQSCGTDKREAKVTAWQEHDHHDKPEHLIVFLCQKCAARMIEPHPRLYRQLRQWHPWPGAMEICEDCKLRDGVSCKHPAAMQNGGSGIHITFPQPTRGFVDGRDYSGPVVFWAGPATACAGKESCAR